MQRVIQAVTTTMRQRPLLARIVILFAVIALVAGHGAFLYYIRVHLGMSLGVIAGVVLLVLVKHLGLLTPVFARFRRRSGVNATPNAERKASSP